jgi:hypothetical protein
MLRLLDHGGMLKWTTIVDLSGSTDRVDLERLKCSR